MIYKNVRNAIDKSFLIFLLILGISLLTIRLTNAEMSIENSNCIIDQKGSNIESKFSTPLLPNSAEQNTESFNMSKISTIDEFGLLKSTFVVGDYAYLADCDFGLRILNIIDKSNPFVVGQYKNEGLALDVQVIGNYAYLANGKEGLEIIDISDPTQPEKIGEFKEGDGCSKIKVEGNRAFISSSYYPIKIIDISNPGNPIKIGEITESEINFSFFKNFEVSGNFVYVPDYFEGLLIFNVSDVTNPTLMSQYQEYYFITYDVYIVENLAYITGWTGYMTEIIFKILDISNPANPLLICSKSGHFSTYDISISDNFAYCNFVSGFKIFNITNPNNIIEMGSYSDDGEAFSIFVCENYVYLSDFNTGLKIIDVSNPSHPFKIAGFEDGEYFSDFVIEDHYIYLVDTCYGLKIIDISNPAKSKIIGRCNLRNYNGKIAIKGNYTYITNGEDGFEVIDVSDPTNPTIVANYADMTNMGNIKNIEIAGNYAFLINYHEFMDIIDISNPLNPTKVKSYTSNSNLDIVKVYGDLACLILGNGLIEFLNVSDPINPILISEYQSKEYSLDFPYMFGHQILLKDNFAYLAFNGLEIIDISDLSNPTYITKFENGTHIKDVQIYENFTWIIDNEGIKILDTSAPTNISIIGQYNIPYLFKLQIKENYVYTCSYYKLSIFELADQNPRIYGMPIYWIIIISGFGVFILILKSRKHENIRKK